MRRSLKKPMRTKKVTFRSSFWTRVWKGGKDELHVLSLILFLGIMFYFVVPHVYELVLNILVADILQKLP